MDFEEEEENLTVYIEELKSDDSNLKLNAVQRILQISQVIGPVRSRNELIPFLIEIIEECDNDDEFLINLADQLSLLKDQIGGEEYVHLILGPLEIISSMEETQIRQKALQSIIKISENMKQNFFTKYFLNIVKQLSKWEHFYSRISACFLIHVCYPHVNETDKQDLIQIFQELCKDDSPLVRRSIAENLGQLLDQVSNQYEQILIQSWRDLLQDNFDSVKVKALETGANIINKINQNLSQDQITQIFLSFNNCSWRIRYALAESIPAFITILNENEKNNLILTYKKLLQDSEQEVKSIALIKLPDLLQQLKPQQFQQIFLDEIINLSNDQSFHVRSSLAQIIYKFVKLIDEQQIQSLIYPLIEKLFKDEVIDVKQNLLFTFGIIKQKAIIIQGQFITNYNELLIRKELEVQYIYERARYAVVEQIPNLCKNIRFETYQSQFQRFINSFMLDHYQAIRILTFKNYIQLSQIYGYDNIKNDLIRNIIDLSKNKNYIFRVSAIQSLEILKDIFQTQDIQDLFENNFINYQNDRVSNVKFNFFKVYKSISEKLTKQQRSKIKLAAQKLQNDQDSDIAFYASQI